FVIGFQNNAVYGRIWEARKIWGGIVNTSRTLGTFVQDMVSNEHAKEAVSDEVIRQEVKTLTYRHIAWMTALRHAMRLPKPWETTSNHRTNTEWGIKPPERNSDLKADLSPYLTDSELAHVMSLDNAQTALLYLQSHHLKRLKEKGLIWEF
ncbi:MAG: bestrophin family ion channel, partial [Pseudomonadales bacterium]